MKNMQVKQKLIVSFLIVAIITAVVGVVGVAGLLTLNTNEGTIYNLGINGGYAEQIGKNIQKQRSAYRDLIIHINDASKVDSSANLLDTLSREYDDLYAYLDKNILTEQGRKYLSVFNDAYAGAFKPLREQLVRTARSGDEQGSLAIINSMVESMGVIVSATDGLSDYAAQVASDTNNKDSKTAYTLVAVSGALAAISVATAIFFALYLSGLISKPLKLMTDCLLKISTTGDLTVSKEEAAAIANRANDEIGQCIGACDSLSRRLIAVNENLGKVASGDLSVDMKLLSEQDSMGRAIIQMIDSLNAMFGELKVSSNQVSSGSGQMAHSAQELASGSTEQAASVQALSATVSEVREQVDDNAVRSQKALENCETAGNLMLDSMESMNRMMDAMSAIGESSRNITRVIKVIDDIAFQTNILALNAAVEAARAGQHGKGFAVVADEVRSLAAKSAEAAKETSALIEGSTSRVTEGGSIVEQTNASMKSVGVTMEENTILIKDMVQSLDRQKGSIVVVNQGMDRISTVVQANAATAQESAAAVEELSSQADVLNGIIARFKLKQTGNGSARALTVQKAKPHMSRVSSGFAISGGEQGGKY